MNRLKWDKENFGRIDKRMGYDLQISGEYSTNLFMCRRATGEAGSKLSIGRLSSYEGFFLRHDYFLSYLPMSQCGF